MRNGEELREKEETSEVNRGEVEWQRVEGRVVGSRVEWWQRDEMRCTE